MQFPRVRRDVSRSDSLQTLVTSDVYYRQLKRLLEDPNVRDVEGNTLLHIAAQSTMYNFRTVRLLIQRGADVNSTNPNGNTPLHFAVAIRKRYAVVALIKAEAFVNLKNSLGRTALHFSVCNGQWYHVEPVHGIECDMWIVERLLSHPKIRLNPVDQMEETPLVWAVKERNSDAMRALLKKGADPNFLNEDNQTPLHVALSVRDPNYDVAGVLFAHGASIYFEDNLGNTAMDVLISNFRVDDDSMLPFAKHAIWQIALRYHIRDCMWRKLEEIPDLYIYLNECCKEVSLMKKSIVYDKVTLHDFCLNCFQTRFGDSLDLLREICHPVADILKNGLFKIYEDFIFCHLSDSDLYRAIHKTYGKSFIQNIEPSAPEKESIDIIRLAYGYNYDLKKRLRLLDYLL